MATEKTHNQNGYKERSLSLQVYKSTQAGHWPAHEYGDADY